MKRNPGCSKPNIPDYGCACIRATLAALHNDGLLILDELSQIDPKEAGEAAYLLANGQGKSRATCYGTVKQSARWTLLFLSAGEESLSALMARAGQRPNAGQEIRLADIEADAGAGMGIFEQLHKQSTPAEMALALKEYASRYHGAVGSAWLRQIVSHRQQLSNDLAKSMQQFIAEIPLQDCPGQILRVARRFALVAAAGELASQYGLTGWTKGEAFSATHTCFKSWLDNFGFNGNREDRMILCQVRTFFESYGASRFESVNSPNNERINHRAGFFRTADNGERIYMVLPEVFRNELCQGYDLRIVARVLINAGWIEPGNDGKAPQKLRIRGVGIPRLYVFTSRMWGDERVQSY